MKKIEFEIEGDYIELNQLLKATGIAQTGGHAGMLITQEQVKRNGEIEIRKRAKIVKGDTILLEGIEIRMI